MRLESYVYEMLPFLKVVGDGLATEIPHEKLRLLLYSEMKNQKSNA